MRGLRMLVGLGLMAMVLVSGSRAESGSSIVFTVEITPDPVTPFEPWLVDVTVTGCTPGDPADFTYVRSNPYTDYVTLNPNDHITLTTDGSGSAATAFSARAYPGLWDFSVTCSGRTASQSVEVPVPDDFAIQVSPARVTRNEPFSLHVEGAGCRPGGTIEWYVAVFPIAQWASGSTTARADGTWSAEGTGNITGPGSDLLTDRAPVTAYCLVDQLISVPYPSVFLELAPAVGPPPDPAPPVVTPRFTG